LKPNCGEDGFHTCAKTNRQFDRPNKAKRLGCTHVAGVLLAVLASPAFALSAWITNGSFSDVVGAQTINFGISSLNNTQPVAGALPSGTAGGVQYTYSGGALFNYGAGSTLPNGTSARPVGSAGNYWSIGPQPVAQQGPGIVTFSSGISYFGFLWGSPDAYNSVSFYSGDTLLGRFDGSLVLVPPNGNQAFSAYANVATGPGQWITKVRFDSSVNAFETDNHAFVPAVPEPETYALMAAGLGLLMLAAWRRERFAGLV
jgi:hypothetical protein